MSNKIAPTKTFFGGYLPPVFKYRSEDVAQARLSRGRIVEEAVVAHEGRDRVRLVEEDRLREAPRAVVDEVRGLALLVVYLPTMGFVMGLKNFA